MQHSSDGIDGDCYTHASVLPAFPSVRLSVCPAAAGRLLSRDSCQCVGRRIVKRPSRRPTAAFIRRTDKWTDRTTGSQYTSKKRLCTRPLLSLRLQSGLLGWPSRGAVHVSTQPSIPAGKVLGSSRHVVLCGVA